MSEYESGEEKKCKEEYDIQQTCNAIQLLEVKVPKFQVSNKKSIVQISCGMCHTVFLTNDNEVYTLGQNSMAQLGIGFVSPFDKNYLKPQLVNMEWYGQVLSICATFTACFVLVFEKSNRLSLRPNLTEHRKQKTIKSSKPSFVLYSWGYGKYGELGAGECILQKVLPFEILKVGAEISEKSNINFNLFSGLHEMCFVIKSKSMIFMWGDVNKIINSCADAYFVRTERQTVFVWKPTDIPITHFSDNANILSIKRLSFGHNFSALLSNMKQFRLLGKYAVEHPFLSTFNFTKDFFVDEKSSLDLSSIIDMDNDDDSMYVLLDSQVLIYSSYSRLRYQLSLPGLVTDNLSSLNIKVNKYISNRDTKIFYLYGSVFCFCIQLYFSRAKEHKQQYTEVQRNVSSYIKEVNVGLMNLFPCVEQPKIVKVRLHKFANILAESKNEILEELDEDLKVLRQEKTKYGNFVSFLQLYKISLFLRKLKEDNYLLRCRRIFFDVCGAGEVREGNDAEDKISFIEFYQILTKNLNYKLFTMSYTKKIFNSILSKARKENVDDPENSNKIQNMINVEDYLEYISRLRQNKYLNFLTRVDFSLKIRSKKSKSKLNESKIFEYEDKNSQEVVVDYLALATLDPDKPVHRIIKNSGQACKKIYFFFVEVFIKECIKRNIWQDLNDLEQKQIMFPFAAESSLQDTYPSFKAFLESGFKLNFSGLSLRDDHIFCLSVALKTVPVVSSLNLRNNKITMEGVDSILELLEHQDKLAEYQDCAICLLCKKVLAFEDTLNYFLDENISCSCSPLSRGGHFYKLPLFYLEFVKLRDDVEVSQVTVYFKTEILHKTLIGLTDILIFNDNDEVDRPGAALLDATELGMEIDIFRARIETVALKLVKDIKAHLNKDLTDDVFNQEIKRVFKETDVDKSGYVDLSELILLAKRLGIKTPLQKRVSIVKKLDMPSIQPDSIMPAPKYSGLKYFSKYWIQYKSRNQVIRELFEQFDENSDNQISLEEFILFIKSILSKQDIKLLGKNRNSAFYNPFHFKSTSKTIQQDIIRQVLKFNESMSKNMYYRLYHDLKSKCIDKFFRLLEKFLKQNKPSCFSVVFNSKHKSTCEMESFDINPEKMFSNIKLEIRKLAGSFRDRNILRWTMNNKEQKQFDNSFESIIEASVTHYSKLLRSKVIKSIKMERDRVYIHCQNEIYVRNVF